MRLATLVLVFAGVALAQETPCFSDQYNNCAENIDCPLALEADLNSCECSIAIAQLECWNAYCGGNQPELSSFAQSNSATYCPVASSTVQLVTTGAHVAATAGITAAGGSTTAAATPATGGHASTAGSTAATSTPSKAAANGLGVSALPVGGIAALVVGLAGLF